MYTLINGSTHSGVAGDWGAIMFSRIITYHLGTVYISPSSVSAWHSLSRALCPLRLMKRSTLLQIMHFTGGTLVDFSCSIDDLLANLAFLEGATAGWSVIRYAKEFRPLFGIRLKNTVKTQIKHRKTTHYPIYSITFEDFVRSQPIAGKKNCLSLLALPCR